MKQRLKRSTLWRMLGFLRPVRGTMILATLVVLGRICFDVAAVAYLRPVVTSLAHLPRPVGSQGVLAWLGQAQGFHRAILLLVVAQLGLTILVYLRPIWEAKLSVHAIYHMRQLIFDRLQHCGFSFHNRISSGKLINRALTDLQVVNTFVNMALLTGLDVALSVAAYVALLLVCSLWLGLVLVVAVPLGWWLISRLSKRMRAPFEQQQQASDELMAALTETIGGVQVVRSCGTEARETCRYAQLNNNLLSSVFAVARLQAQLVPGARIIASSAQVVMFALTCVLIGYGRMQLGDLMVLGVAMGTIVVKMQSFNLLAESYRKASVSAQRLFEIIDGQPEVAATGKAQPLNLAGNGTIAYSGVVFGYEPTRPVLQQLDLTIPGAKVTAIVGATGSGKSTLVSLISRFYDPWQGRICIDGQDLRFVDLESLRRSVGYVFQETFLFSDTIGNNLRYGRADVTPAMVEAAAKAAQAHGFISALPHGYDTMLGEHGVMLSGGQRQRLALARALVYDPRILVLDDATAALDARTERMLHTAVAPLLARRTVLVIAHRLATVQRADYVVVMAGGRIVEAGSHGELWAKGGAYCEVLRLRLDDSPGVDAGAEVEGGVDAGVGARVEVDVDVDTAEGRRREPAAPRWTVARAAGGYHAAP